MAASTAMILPVILLFFFAQRYFVEGSRTQRPEGLTKQSDDEHKHPHSDNWLPVPFTNVKLDDPFWAPRQEINRTVSIPHMYQMCVDTGRIGAFDLNFTREVPSPIVLIFGDSDPAKWLEAACYSLGTHPDPELAQSGRRGGRQDHRRTAAGRLSQHALHRHPARDALEEPARLARDVLRRSPDRGAVAHYQATGQRKLLDCLCRYADHIDRIFGPEPGQRPRLLRPSRDRAGAGAALSRHRRTALPGAVQVLGRRARPVATRITTTSRRSSAATTPRKFWATTYEYCQAHEPIREQDKVVGHAVRAMYLMSRRCRPGGRVRRRDAAGDLRPAVG